MRRPFPRPFLVALAALSGALNPMSASADSGSAEEAPAVSTAAAKPPSAPMTEDEAAPPDESEPGPGEAAPPPAPAAKPAAGAAAKHAEHVVAAGDTLGGIAHHYHIPTDTLATANGMTRLTPIRIGQRLIVPAPGEVVHMPERTHVVGRGNTLGGISRRYGVSIEALLTANHLKRTDRLQIGQKLAIPGGEDAAPPPAAASGPHADAHVDEGP